MLIEDFLARLQGVRPAGEGRWTARCPAHLDHDPSLAIRLTEDGKILVFCFAGCLVGRIVEAMGLRLADLFPGDASWRPTPAVRRTKVAEEFIRVAMQEAETRLADLFRRVNAELANGGWEAIMNGNPAAESLACRAARLSWWEHLLDEMLAGEFPAFIAAAQEVARFGSI